MKKTLLSLVALATIACGQTGGTGGTKSGKGNEPLGDPNATQAAAVANAWAVASEDDLPECDAARKGQLYFVESDETFRVCRSNGWAEIDLRGEDGQDGTNGKDGKNGTNGTNGKDGANGATGATGATGAGGSSGATSFDIIQKIACTKDINADWQVKYSAIEFSNHMVFVTCVAKTLETQVSYSTIYADSQNGSYTGYCGLRWDVDGGGGEWEFTYDWDAPAGQEMEIYYESPTAGPFTYYFDLTNECVTLF